MFLIVYNCIGTPHGKTELMPLPELLLISSIVILFIMILGMLLLYRLQVNMLKKGSEPIGNVYDNYDILFQEKNSSLNEANDYTPIKAAKSKWLQFLIILLAIFVCFQSLFFL